ncbi:MAG: aminoglycoside phosphotransferase family protein [Bacteroidota bacterium]|nr:aminoglycoside phosphotransferase family protein [Bacteroidota bacterium]
MLQPVFDAFGLSMEKNKAVPFGSGLINHTWKINGGEKSFILQKINTKVFKNPDAIAYNIYITGKYLRAHDSSYLFVIPQRSVYHKDIFFDEKNGYFRLLPFVENSHTIDVVKDPQMAYEAARQFGLFTKLLSGLDACMLKITLPDFHNLSFRYEQFEEALAKAGAGKIKQSKELIDLVFAHKDIVDEFEKIKINPQFKIRVTHHDTKISNVLFDEDNKGLCVIDLDTMMPGYFISDLGDMLRTYLSPVSEEEKDFSKIEIRDDYFLSIIRGYLGELHDVLTDGEKSHFVYAGKFMIYMQALRFLTDHLNNDIYYGAKYPGHNFVRTGNQFALLEKLTQKEDELQEYVDSLTLAEN